MHAAEAPADLGMPRLWSALVPQSYIQQPPVTANAMQQLPAESEAAASAAKQVLAAGQVYNEAVRQLETALKGNKPGQDEQSAAHDISNGADAAPAADVDHSVDMTDRLMASQAMQVDNPAVSQQKGEAQPPERTFSKASGVLAEHSAVSDQEPATAAAVNTVLPENVDTGLQENNDSSKMIVENSTDDGFISLLPEHSLSRRSEPASGKVVSMLADAESSDSQGSLPEIDSGESDSENAASEL